MVFRDDRAALVERLAQLEREAADAPVLRERVATLEAENRNLAALVHELRARLAPPAPLPPPQPARGAIALRIAGPTGIGDITFDQDIVRLGNNPRSQVRLEHPDVSRLHAVIERSDDGLHIIDLGSSAGTLVNGRRVSKARVASGDTIAIGPFRITVAVG